MSIAKIACSYKYTAAVIADEFLTIYTELRVS